MCLTEENLTYFIFLYLGHGAEEEAQIKHKRQMLQDTLASFRQRKLGFPARRCIV